MLVATTSIFAAKKTTKGQVRYLNFKPEVASIYQELAAVYEKETGVKVIVETAANNAYESTLTSKMATKQAPTLFQINGPRGYANWKNYCAELSNTELYKHLTDKSLAVTSGGKVYGIPYVVEGYGIIYNSAITDKYFALPNKATKYKSMDEVNNFAALKEVCDDMQANKEALGIKGVFASTSLKAGEDWRWQTHLANLPVYYEFKNNKVDLASDATKKISFQYDKEFKNIFDLYLNDSVIPAKNVGVKTVDNSMAEFALEECAMVQNGNWAWGQISGVSGNKVKAENVKYLPIYTGVAGEEGQGLCIGTENFYCINKKASKQDQQATADFIYWLYSSKTGKKYVTEKLGFIAPFDTFADNERPTDPLAVEISNWMAKPGITSVAWNFTLFPSQTFKDNFGASLLRYAQGAKSWEDVKASVVKDWASESDM
ncbi:MAG: ABC transporter substrate-binding protein [Spirochaetales bacterium]|nr:ABC transporter substrate-binding protein [Spirochaetales bacterium]MDY5916757.1 ABC transporter substrate-binding protein [Treponema sp.]